MDFKLNYRDEADRQVDNYGSGDYDYEWETDHSYDYRSISITDARGDVSLFPGESEPKLGDNIYVVYVSYDTGDSFGHESNIHTHLWAFTNAENAANLCSAIEKDYKENPDYNYDHKPFTYSGVDINVNEWKGYFESLNSCDYVTLELRRK